MEFEHLRIRDVHAVLRFRPDKKTWRAERRRNHIVGVMLNGAARHDFGDRSFVLSGNSVFFFNQREDYDVSVLEAGESFSVHFTTWEEIETESFAVPVANVGELVSLLSKAAVARSEGDELRMLSLLYRLCAELARMRERPYAPKDGRMVAARAYLDAHCEERDCVASAIAASGVTSRRFGELFRHAFATTPNRYLVTRRIKRAKELLAAEGVSVTEVAELCGFSDVYYFSKVFKRETGIAPGQWNDREGG